MRRYNWNIHQLKENEWNAQKDPLERTQIIFCLVMKMMDKIGRFGLSLQGMNLNFTDNYETKLIVLSVHFFVHFWPSEVTEMKFNILMSIVTNWKTLYTGIWIPHKSNIQLMVTEFRRFGTGIGYMSTQPSYIWYLME